MAFLEGYLQLMNEINRAFGIVSFVNVSTHTRTRPGKLLLQKCLTLDIIV